MACRTCKNFKRRGNFCWCTWRKDEVNPNDEPKCWEEPLASKVKDGVDDIKDGIIDFLKSDFHGDYF